MRRTKIILLAVTLILGFSVPGHAVRREYKSAVRSLSRQKQIELAMSAAPERVSKKATIMLPDKDGELVVVRKGTNGFTCVPDIDGQEIPSPMCADEATMRFFLDMWSGKERPANKIPGVGYMAQGGWHWEKDGEVIMSMAKDEPGAKRVREPAHWMLIYPFTPEKTFLQPKPSAFGTWIMFDGTPFAHLMIYQDPMSLGE
jgi:hypothetical protein